VKDLTSVADPHRLCADPDPDLKMNADPDPGYSNTLRKITFFKDKNVKFE
jgi:hypothetical protein